MAFEDKAETMVCPDCNTAHTVEWSRLPVREVTKVDCLACGSSIFRGKANREYHTVRLAPTVGPTNT